MSIRLTELDINQHGNPDEGKTWSERLNNFRSVISPRYVPLIQTNEVSNTVYRTLLIPEKIIREAEKSLNETKNIIRKDGFIDLNPSARDKLFKDIESK